MYGNDNYDDGDEGDMWYYCRNPEGYYPYVKHCNGEWQQVPATPEQSYNGNDDGPDDMNDDDDSDEGEDDDGPGGY